MSGGSAVLSMSKNSSATFSFTGTGASWIAYEDEWSGIAEVYVDGVSKGKVDTYVSPAKAQQKAFSVSGLPAGKHTLKIVVTGTHSSASKGSWVWVDAFEYTTTQ